MLYNRIHLSLCLIPIILLWSCHRKPDNQSPTVENAGFKIEQIKLLDLNGQPIDLSLFKGKVIFINFWATWCRPCIEEMPSIERARAQFKDSNIEFFVASNEEEKRIENFIKKRGLNLKYVRVANLEELNVQSLPTTYIIDANGNLVFSEAGYRKWDDTANIEMINKIIMNHD